MAPTLQGLLGLARKRPIHKLPEDGFCELRVQRPIRSTRAALTYHELPRSRPTGDDPWIWEAKAGVSLAHPTPQSTTISFS